MSMQKSFFHQFTSTSRSRLIFFAVCLCIVAAALILVYFRTRPPGHLPRSRRVAVNLPLSGPVAVFFDPFPKGLALGIEDELRRLKAPEASISLDIQDNSFKSDQAKSILLSQKARGFDVYISGSSDISVALFPELDMLNFPHFLVAFDAFMVERGQQRLRLLPHYKIEGPAWVSYAKGLKAKRVFALTLNNAAIEEEFSKIVDTGLRDENITIQRERFGFEGADFRSLVAKAQAANPDVIFVSGYSFHLEPALNAIRSSAALKGKPIMTAMDLIDLVTQHAPLSLIQDVVFVAPEFEIAEETANSSNSQGKIVFKARYAAIHNKAPNYIAAYGYDTGVLLARVLTQNSTLFTRSDFVKQTPMDGASGRVILDKNGDLTSTLTLVTVNKDYQLRALIVDSSKKE